MLTNNEQIELDVLLTIQDPDEYQSNRIKYLKDKQKQDDSNSTDKVNCDCIHCALENYKGSLFDLPLFMTNHFIKNLELKYPLKPLEKDTSPFEVWSNYTNSLPEKASEGKKLDYNNTEVSIELLPTFTIGFYNSILQSLGRTDNLAVFTGCFSIDVLHNLITMTEILHKQGFSYKSSAKFALKYMGELLESSTDSIKMSTSNMSVTNPIKLKEKGEIYKSDLMTVLKGIIDDIL